MRQLKNGEQLALSPLEQVKCVVPGSVANAKSSAGALQQAAVVVAAARPLQEQQVGSRVLGQAELAERMQQLQLAVQQDAAVLGGKIREWQLQAVGALQAQQVSAVMLGLKSCAAGMLQ
jgi:hypothetical protein